MLKTILLLKLKSLKAALQYPASFVIQVVAVSLIGFVGIVSILVLANAFPSIGGWSFWEVGFMLSLWRLSHSVHHALFFSFFSHILLVRNGEFDRILVRPVHPLLQIMASGLNLSAIGEALPAMTLFFMTWRQVKVAWSLSNVVFLVVVVFSGAVIKWAVELFFEAFDFWLGRASLLWIPQALETTGQYPAHIYGPVLSSIVTFVFPYAFVAYYPTHYFHQLDVGMFSSVFPILPPLVATGSLAVAVAFWSIGLRHYQSTGT